MTPRMFPIQSDHRVTKPHPTSIPWEVADLAYSVYAAEYGRSQSLERLAERGGFGAGEMDLFLPDWRERCSAIDAATKQLREEVERLKAELADAKDRVEAIRELRQIETGQACAFADQSAKLADERADQAAARNKALVEALTKGWLIWSNEHAAWWNPERLGYTQRIEEAGRYSLEEAEACAEMRSRAAVPPEVIVPSPELRAVLAAHEERSRSPLPLSQPKQGPGQ